MNLYDYQKEFLRNLYNELYKKRVVAAVAPTGSGKTVMMAQVCKDAVRHKKSVLIVVHLDILVPQTLDKLRKAVINEETGESVYSYTGCIKANYPEDRDALIQVGSVQTMLLRPWWKTKNFDLVLFDEAHVNMFGKVGKEILQIQEEKNKKVVGFTATPYRLSNKESFHLICDGIVSAPLPSQLQEMGFLSKMKYFSFPEVDLSGVRTVAGDYNKKDLSIACNNTELIAHIYDEWRRLCNNLTTLAYCVDVQHAVAVSDYFNSKGVKSAVVSDKTPIKKRTELYAAIASGDLTLLSSVNVISIGFDVPSVRVGLGLRPTKSLALFHQMIGRIMRVHPGKDFGIWLDQAGNCLERSKLILPEQVTEYTLHKKINKEGGEAIYKVCEEKLIDAEKSLGLSGCGYLNLGFAMKCPNCGAHFKKAVKLAPVGVQLKEINLRNPEEKAKEYYRKQLRKAYVSRTNPDRCYHELKAKYSSIPRPSWAANAIFGENPTEESFKAYWNYLIAQSNKHNKSHDWAAGYFLKVFSSNEALSYYLNHCSNDRTSA